MFKNYLKTAARNLSKNKLFTTLNVVGLALGMSLNLLFVAMVVFVFQFDDFHSNKENVYRIITHVQDRHDNPSFASAPVGAAQLLKGHFEGVERVVRIHQSVPRTVYRGETEISIKGYFADADYLSVFDFPLVQGDPATSLVHPNTMVVTEAAAARIFGGQDPMGEVVSVEPFGEVVITGVAKDMPKNTHLKAEALVSYATLTSHYGPAFTDDERNWTHFHNAYTYLQLADGASPAAVEAFLNGVAQERYTTPEFQASFELQPLGEVAPGPELDNDMGNEYSYLELVLLGILPLIVLLAACGNYVSLAIAQSLRRMKSIGVRKVMGARKRQVFTQFVMESTVTMLLAVTLSYVFFEIIRGEALSLTGAHEWVDLSPTPGTLLAFLAFALGVGFVAGVVPALRFSRMDPVQALKGNEPQTKRGGRFTLPRVVITSQFILSLGFILAMVIMVQQHRYSTNYDLGFERHNIVNVDLQRSNPQRVKDEFEKLSFSSPISMSSHLLGAGSVPGVHMKRTGHPDSLNANRVAIDEHFITNMGLHLVLGRDFTDDVGENARSIIINEVFAKALSPDDASKAVGEVVVLDDSRDVRVVGVLEDFHYASLHAPVGNFFFEYAPDDFNYANFRLLSGDERQAFIEMEAAWKAVGTDNALKAAFLTDQINDAYASYEQIVKMWGFMGLLAISIACLGLLGMVVFTVRKRVKEVSIRKVLGASSESLVYLLSRDFLALLTIAAAIAVPSVYLLMDMVLQEAQYYHAPISASAAVISLAVVLLLGLTTIGSQTLKAANTNPADNLRLE